MGQLIHLVIVLLLCSPVPSGSFKCRPIPSRSIWSCGDTAAFHSYQVRFAPQQGHQCWLVSSGFNANGSELACGREPGEFVPILFFGTPQDTPAIAQSAKLLIIM